MANIPYPFGANSKRAIKRDFMERFGLVSSPMYSAVTQISDNNPSTTIKTAEAGTWLISSREKTGLIPVSGGGALHVRLYMGKQLAAAAARWNSIVIALNTGSYLHITGSILGATANDDESVARLSGWLDDFGTRTDISDPVTIRLATKDDTGFDDRAYYPHSFQAWVTYKKDLQMGSIVDTGSVYYN